jgi:hypothetical protein
LRLFGALEHACIIRREEPRIFLNTKVAIAVNGYGDVFYADEYETYFRTTYYES